MAATPSQHPHGPARVGRGGAGNFIDPKHAAQGEGLQADETGTAVASSLRGHSQPHRAGWSGRGGAGNFHADLAAEEERARVEEDGRSRAELDRKIKEAVEKEMRESKDQGKSSGAAYILPSLKYLLAYLLDILC